MASAAALGTEAYAASHAPGLGQWPGPPGNDYLTIQALPLGANLTKGSLQQFSVLCGEEPPTVTDGYAIWTSVARPMLRGVTVPQGFMPAQMKVSVKFGVWDGRFGINGWDDGSFDPQDRAGRAVEADITLLEWMAGAQFSQGPSPVVYIASYFANGAGQSYLVPPPYRNMSWVINGGLTWKNIIRNQNTRRVVADCDFTLLNYQNFGISAPRPASSLAGGYFKTSAAWRTPLAIAANPSSRSPQAYHQILAGRICADPKNNPIRNSRVTLNGKGIHYKIPIGKSVWVPTHQQ